MKEEEGRVKGCKKTEGRRKEEAEKRRKNEKEEEEKKEWLDFISFYIKYESNISLLLKVLFSTS